MAEDSGDTKVEKFTIRYIRPPNFQMVTPDSFNLMKLSTPDGESYSLSVILHDVRYSEESFDAEVAGNFVQQVGKAEHGQEHLKIEVAQLRLSIALAEQLASVLIRNVGSAPLERLQSVLEERRKTIEEEEKKEKKEKEGPKD